MSFYFIESFRKKKFWELLLVFIWFILKSWIPSGIWSLKVSFSVDKKKVLRRSHETTNFQKGKRISIKRKCVILWLCILWKRNWKIWKTGWMSGCWKPERIYLRTELGRKVWKDKRSWADLISCELWNFEALHPSWHVLEFNRIFDIQKNFFMIPFLIVWRFEWNLWRCFSVFCKQIYEQLT